MIFSFRDGTEAVYLSLILKAIKEQKSVEELLRSYTDEKQMAMVMEQLHKFAISKLDHPILSFAISEMDKLIKVKRQEAKTKWIKFLIP